MSIKLDLAMNQSYYGISSFDSIMGSSQKNNPYAAIYGASSQQAQLGALNSAISSIKSNMTGLSNGTQKELLSNKLSSITTAMKNSFEASTGQHVFTKTDTRSIRQMAQENADQMMKEYFGGTTIDQLI